MRVLRSSSSFKLVRTFVIIPLAWHFVLDSVSYLLHDRMDTSDRNWSGIRMAGITLVVVWGKLIFNVSEKSNSHLSLLVSSKRVADERCFDLNLYLSMC